MMQWFVNECRAKFSYFEDKIDAVGLKHPLKPKLDEMAEQIEKLKWEIVAMKARMGKKKDG